MDLLSYCAAQGGTGKPNCPVLSAVAVKADCSSATLYMIARGHKTCGLKLAGKIHAATKGRVTFSDLRPDIFAPTRTPKRKAA